MRLSLNQSDRSTQWLAELEHRPLAEMEDGDI